MGGGKSQKGGKHGSIGRTLAHDILLRQSQRSEESRKNMMKKKEYSVYERTNLDEFTMAATQGLESYISRRGTTREVGGNDFNSQLYNFIHFPQVFDDSNFPVIPIPRRSFFFTEEQKQYISFLNRQRYLDSMRSAKKYFKRKNKKKVDMYMHGDVSRPYHGYYNKPHPKNIYNKSETEEKEQVEHAETTSQNTEECSEGYEDVESLTNEEEESSSDEETKVEETLDKEKEKNYYVNKYLKYLKEESHNLDITEFGSEELEKIELKNFYMWRSLLSEVEAREKSVVTPYEKNIDFWRQLWRVIEKSNLVLIILDSRDPLFFRIIDLENYIKEIDESKEFMLVLNKADFINKDLRVQWAKYFKSKNINFVFFSSIYNNPSYRSQNIRTSEEDENPKDETEETQEREENESDYHEEEEDKDGGDVSEEALTDEEEVEGLEEMDYKIYNVELLLKKINKYKEKYMGESTKGVSAEGAEESEKEKGLNKEKRNKKKYVVGFVGYPNVGKSSLINCLMESTKTCVGVQPGKTKHIQTLVLKESDLILCDCPGLIFPTLVCTKYHLLINNIVSTSHFKGNMVLAVQLICNLIPEQVCKKYDININDCLITSTRKSQRNHHLIGNGVSPTNGEQKEESPNKEKKVLFSIKLLELLCQNRNYISGGKGGQLDYTRASKLIINDYTQGVLLYCKEPPTAHKLKKLETNENEVEETKETKIEEDLDKLYITNNPSQTNVKYIGKTINESKKDEENVNQWLKQQLNQGNDKVKMTKRKMRFLIKGKRKTGPN